ncbi:MAG: hypothetical protein KQI62_00010 [Deltaproteobacteria bacterium]|nr:hypothetical protein [Deltaproteobacteria bacterium]
MPSRPSHHFDLGKAQCLELINQQMERQASSGWTDEESLTRLRHQLKQYSGPKGQAFWLTLARLGELALWWTGCLADAGEFQAVGDLLLNPPGKTLYIRNRPTPLRLARHVPISEQVRPLAPAGVNLVQWLKHQTVMVVEAEPLLPALLDDLSRWPHYAPEACRDFQLRLDRVAGVLCQITALNLPQGVSLAEHLARAPQEEAEAIKKHLCRFDLKRFDGLGLALRNLPPTSAPLAAAEQGAPKTSRAPQT